MNPTPDDEMSGVLGRRANREPRWLPGLALGGAERGSYDVERDVLEEKVNLS